MKTIDLTPSTDGYASIAKMFAENILDDVKVRRQNDDRVLLSEFTKIAGQLARTDAAAFNRLVLSIEHNEVYG